MAVCFAHGGVAIHSNRSSNMGGPDPKNQPPGKDEDKPKKPPPVPIEDDDIDDGDFATPKHDHIGDDDEPL